MSVDRDESETKSKIVPGNAFWQALTAAFAGALVTALLTVGKLDAAVSHLSGRVAEVQSQGEKTLTLTYEVKAQVSALSARMNYVDDVEKPRLKHRN